MLRGFGSLGVIGLAGCVDESNTSENSDPDDGTENEAEDIGFPPGVSESGIDDAAALVDAHRSAVLEASFTYESVERYRETDEATGESTTRVMDSVEIWAEPDAERVAKVDYEGPLGGEVDEGVYVGGDRSATTDGGPVPESAEEVIETAFGSTSAVENVAGEYVGTKTPDDVPVHEISVTEIGMVLAGDDPDDEEGTVLIDEDGRIHRFRITQTAEQEDARSAVEIEFEFSEFGTTTVEEPEWVDERVSTEPRLIEPGTWIELEARSVSWVGSNPSSIAGVENPTLVLREGELYTIHWSNESSLQHNVAIYDDNEDTVNGRRTEVVAEPGDDQTDQTLEFEASAEMAEYVCEPHHAAGMAGDIEVR